VRNPRAIALAALALVAIAAVVAIIIASPARPVYAHAALIRSNPANGEKVARPPVRVILNFSEPIERRLTKIEVFGKDKERVDDGEIEFDDKDETFASIGLKDLNPGLYLVQFDNVSTVDGHPWRGVFQFIVLNPDGAVPAGAEFNPEATAGATTSLLPKPVDAALKWIALLALAAAAGAAFWVRAVAKPAAAFLDDDNYDNALAASERWLVNLGHILLPASFLAMAALVLLTVSRFETGTTLGTYLVSIRAGQYRLLFALSVALALAGCNLLYLASGRRLRVAGTLGTLLMLAASLLGLLTFSLTSHGGVGVGAFWAVVSDFVHLLASAAWLGALAMLVPFLRWIRRGLAAPERFLYMANVFDRFSVVAALSVIAVLATGVFNGLAQIPEFSALFDTTYGRTLVVKLALVAPLLGVAGLNAFWLKPRLVSAIDGVYQDGGSLPEQHRAAAERRLGALQRVLPWTIALEVALAVIVFASVAVLSQTSTAKGELAQEAAQRQAATQFKDQKPAGDLQLEFVIKPNRVGLNEYALTIRNQDGSPATGATQVRLRFFYTDPTNPNLSTGQTELILNKFGEGFYKGSGAYFSQPGSWRVEAGIRREAKDDVSRNFVISVAPAQTRGANDGAGRYALPFTSLEWNHVAGALLVILGGTAVLYGRQIAAAVPWNKRWVATAGTAVLLAGFVLVFAVETGGSKAGLAQENPVKPTEASTLEGRALFQQNCIVCHGVDGRGDGPQAAGLNPAPSDFRLHIPLHTDPQFYAFIANGYPGSAMAAWKEQLSPDDIWNLVNFLRSTFTEAPTQ
jgi:copper transport protein